MYATKICSIYVAKKKKKTDEVLEGRSLVSHIPKILIFLKKKLTVF